MPDSLGGMPLTMILDIVLLAALTGMIISCALLYRRLGMLSRAREEMTQLLSDFSHATLRADHAVNGMKNTAADTGEKLQDRIREGQALLDELNFVLESGQTLADRLERDISTKRSGTPAGQGEKAAKKKSGLFRGKSGKSGKPVPSGDAGTVVVDAPVSRAEKELMQALGKSQSHD